MKIYHNNRCSKSRCSLEVLNESGLEFETVEYLKNPLSKEEIEDLLVKLNLSAEEIIRKSQTEFKEHYKGKKMTEKQWIDAMVKFPILMQRPIIVRGNKAVIGRPVEKVIELINE